MIDLWPACQRMIDVLAGITDDQQAGATPCAEYTVVGLLGHVDTLSIRTLAADLTYEEVLSGETHHAAFFRLQIEDIVVNGMDYALLDAGGKIAEVTIWWRPLPSAVEMQGHLDDHGCPRPVSMT